MPDSTSIFTNQIQVGDLVFFDASNPPRATMTGIPAGVPVFALTTDDFSAPLDKGIITMTPAADGMSVTINPTDSNVGDQSLTVTLGGFVEQFICTVQAAGNFVPPPGPAVSMRLVMRQPTARP
jgi:hypothetical protein